MTNKLQVIHKVLSLAGATCILAATLVSGSSALAIIAPNNQWKFNETTAGAVAVDSVGGMNGTAFGEPAPQPSTDVAYNSPSNPGSMQFDNQNYYEIANTVSADFTICAWIKTLSTGGNVHWTGANFIESEAGGPAFDYGFGIDYQGKLMFGNGGVLNGGLEDATVTGTAVVADNIWHEVCASRNNTTGEVILYVDGALDASGFTGVGLLTANPVARIASGTDGATKYVGLIDDLRIYTQVLSLEDISAENIDLDDISQTGGGLANTGTDNSGLLALVGLLVLLGSGSMIYSRVKRIG